MSISRTALATSALIPALLLGTTGPATAAANTLTITALNRSGTKIATTATVVNLDGSGHYEVRTGTKRKLPKGRYAVITSISTGNSTTLGGKTVTVSGASKLTIDARQGRLVRIGMSPAVTGLSPRISAQICTRTGRSADWDVEAYADEGQSLYAIPTASKKIAGSSTAVALKLSRHLIWGDIKKGAAPKLKSLTTKASFDGGKTWRAVPVRKVAGVWTAVVKNPASGAVSLRTRATYTSGGYTEATIVRAYAIG
ncbi:MAG TPA: hypothetical protein VN408_21000 [Actinoplanes sp.]|nr:hypothetical protein [Actinoplanes sp.]